MKWYSYLICCILIIIGVFCTIELIEVFSVKSGEYGSVISYQTHSDYEEFSKYDFGSIDFKLPTNSSKSLSISLIIVRELISKPLRA